MHGFKCNFANGVFLNMPILFISLLDLTEIGVKYIVVEMPESKLKILTGHSSTGKSLSSENNAIELKTQENVGNTGCILSVCFGVRAHLTVCLSLRE